MSTRSARAESPLHASVVRSESSAIKPRTMMRAAVFTSFLFLGALAFACTTKTTVVDNTTPDSGTSSTNGENAAATEEPAEPLPFALTSSAFADGEALPVKYSCGGDNVSPPLSWTAGPEGTKSYT